MSRDGRPNTKMAKGPTELNGDTPPPSPVWVAKKTGPKEIEVDVELLQRMALIQCSVQEMSLITGVSIDTLSNKYSEIIQRSRADGKRSLKRKLFEMAMQGNIPALIFSLKNWCGMVDSKAEITINEVRSPEEVKMSAVEAVKGIMQSIEEIKNSRRPEKLVSDT